MVFSSQEAAMFIKRKKNDDKSNRECAGVQNSVRCHSTLCVFCLIIRKKIDLTFPAYFFRAKNHIDSSLEKNIC